MPMLTDSQSIPLYGAGLSALILLTQTITGLRSRKKSPNGAHNDPGRDGTDNADPLSQSHNTPFRHFIKDSGGATVFVYKVTRLLSCIVLLALSVASLASHDPRRLGGTAPPPWWLRSSQCAVYAYASALALAEIALPRRRGACLSAHLSGVLLLTWIVYLYRDLLPLATTHWRPADAAEGLLLWVKLAVLTEAAVIVPGFVPPGEAAYENIGPAAGANKEQMAGWYSRRMFRWLNETVARAHRVEHLPLEQLPPLAGRDRTATLVENSMKYLDPLETKKDTHIFWGFLRLYRSEYLTGALLAIGSCSVSLTWPLATQGVLAYLETGRAHAGVRPWAWVLLLFLGPTAGTLCEEWYQWTMDRLSVRTEAVVTELLFQHALRVRVKSETGGRAGPDGERRDERHGEEKGEGALPKSTFLVGRLNNLISSDLANITEGNKQALLLAVQSPVRIAVAVAFMYSVLGWSALVGLGTLLALLAVPGYLSAWIQTFQKEMMSRTDARIQVISEVLNVVRMIKLFGWERRVVAQVDERREAELRYLQLTKWLEVVNNLFNYSVPLVTMAVTFATYTVLMKGELTASKLFSSNAAFLLIQQQMHLIFFIVPVLTQARVSLDRINGFLHETELLDEFARHKHEAHPIPPPPTHDETTLGIKQTSFTWTADAPPQTLASTASGAGREFVLDIAGELLFQRGRTNLIVGPTGSGKTSLLMALLGEMHARRTGPGSFVGLPRAGGVAYAAQESWVLSDTIRNNVLFGAPFDGVRYAKVIKQCALERDLSLFDAGDKTEVGEKGITLSGGQKARITLARAVYSSAEILLLDDVLAALDVHTGRWIVDECFKGDLVRGRTVLLVSHNVALIRPIADFVVALGSDGRIASQGSFGKALLEDQELLAELAEEEEQLKAESERVDKPGEEDAAEESPEKGKLVVAEEIAEGQVGWKTLRLYFMNTSSRPIIYWTVFVLMLLVTHGVMNSQAYVLGVWAAQYEDHNPSEVSVAYYLSIYGISVIVSISAYLMVWMLFISGSIRASRTIHDQLVASVLGTTLRWLDVTPISRIIARCTGDIQAIDNNIPRYILYVIETAIFMVLRVAATALVAPFFIMPAFVIGVLGFWLGRVYMRAQICVKREMSNTRAPVLGHFGSAISGLVSIRAYGAQEDFKNESYARVDRYSRAALIYNGLDRWITVRVEVMGTLLSTILASYLVYFARLSASNAGFAMIMAVGFSLNILGWVKLINYLQVSANSLERVQQYLSVEQELKPSASGVPPAYWPASGHLRVEKLSARYSSDGPRVLHELSFEVRSGERIGIVGRTGSGKSSLTLALLRCILTEGKVYYDGIATDTINLHALRSNITIIPQTPELLSGTLRKNLDPFGQHDDATLNDALRSAGLFSLQENTDSARLTLDSEIAGGGANLSVGQRQILALARAIVRRSNLLILDEATSAIDYETDTIIQTSLREELGRDVTVLTVAHRLQSIMDADKIMVLDAGYIVEYDAPRKLLENENGYFRSLVDGSGDRAALYAQAGHGSRAP